MSRPAPFWNSTPMTTPVSATTLPTDRSNPPEMMRNVWATAMMPSAEATDPMEKKFWAVRKYLLWVVKNTTRMSSTRSSPWPWMRRSQTALLVPPPTARGVEASCDNGSLLCCQRCARDLRLIGALQLSHERAVPHHQHPVTHQRDLLEVG